MSCASVCVFADVLSSLVFLFFARGVGDYS